MIDEMEDVYLGIHQSDTIRKLERVCVVTHDFTTRKTVYTRFAYVWYTDGQISNIDFIDYEKLFLAKDSIETGDKVLSACEMHKQNLNSVILRLSEAQSKSIVYVEIDVYGYKTYYTEERWKARWQAQ
jgi:hypothetical protein